ncbi:MAG: hydrogenase iron-sulfur subunit [Candidatus Bathyarchaeota archaeon]|nr:hydrogenase iron-sulfur subunit [Candidatus Bathyarchaeota archaeon]MDH5494980.1 hydrogenase iron-sulfur subunit [Candidatus Bathyarchaeota archaeon]
MTFRPKIVGFVCNWSLPPEVNITRTSRIQGYPKIHVVRVMCVGRIDPVIILEAFAKGADGVLVIGCHPPDCHYIEGNLQAEQKVNMVRQLVSLTGLESERLRLEWSNAAEVGNFAAVVDDFRNQMIMLGRSSLARENLDGKVLLNVLAAKNAAADFRLRVLVGREKELTEDVNVYGEKISQDDFDDLLGEVVREEFIRHKIHLLTKQKPLSVKGLAAIIDMKPALVLRHIVDMRRKGMIALDSVEETTPIYKALEVQ